MIKRIRVSPEPGVREPVGHERGAIVLPGALAQAPGGRAAFLIGPGRFVCLGAEFRQ